MNHWMRTIVVSLGLVAGCATEATDSEDERGAIGKADIVGSCAGEGGDLCGGPGDGNCFCDEACEDFGDCCSDVLAVCGFGPAGCCDPSDNPGGPEGAWCCADGSWQADLGNGDPMVCDSFGGQGDVCAADETCCDPADDPGGPEGSWCCADGSWQADLGNGDPMVCDSFGGLGDVCSP